MAVDYESAFVALQEFVASKSQHGREGLLIKMSELASSHRYPGDELVLRLQGVVLPEGSAPQPHQAAVAEFEGGFDSTPEPRGADHHPGDDDGHVQQHAADPAEG